MIASQVETTPVDRLRWVSGILAILGLADAGYLAWIKLANAVAACSGIGDCASVNSSRYAEMWGIPVALFGVATYLVIVALLVVEGRWKQNFYLFRLGVFGVTLVGTLYSAYLTYVEVAILRAICPYCVISAVLVTALFVLSIIRLRAEDESA